MTASKIEWTDRSDWNPVRGCTRVSPGCGGPGQHGGCYAEALAARFSGVDPKTGKPMWGHGFAEMVSGQPRWTGKVALQHDRLTIPMSWRAPARVFANSTSDFFHEMLPDADIDEISAVMALCPHLTFQVLTKRAARMRRYWTDPETPGRIAAAIAGHDHDGAFAQAATHDKWMERLKAAPLPNLWLGVSCERQQEANERIPELLATPAVLRFISAEPLLGPIDLSLGKWVSLFSGRFDGPPTPQLDWVIAGGESGRNARPMHPAWARSLRDQCEIAGVPFFFKQWGEWAPYNPPTVEMSRGGDPPDVAWPDGTIAHGTAEQHGGPGQSLGFARGKGKSKNGRLLDGREHNAMPTITSQPQASHFGGKTI
jgi:protein gp37